MVGVSSDQLNLRVNEYKTGSGLRFPKVHPLGVVDATGC